MKHDIDQLTLIERMQKKRRTQLRAEEKKQKSTTPAATTPAGRAGTANGPDSRERPASNS